MTQKLLAELIGTAFLLIGVVGSGIMGQTLSGGNVAIALLANAIATGAMLYAIITTLGPISGAHFNPAVTLAFALRGELPWKDVAPYVLTQIVGGILGVWAAHAMFELPVWQFSAKPRTGTGQWLGEGIATFGLVLTILGTIRANKAWVPASVGLYITAAYWFTSSTSFANPAITVGRSLTDSFSGIAPGNVLGFVVAQLAGAVLAVGVARWLWGESEGD